MHDHSRRGRLGLTVLVATAAIIGGGLLLRRTSCFTQASIDDGAAGAATDKTDRDDELAPMPSRCAASPLSKDELIARVTEARRVDPRLPPPAESYTAVVRREGCHYDYQEHSTDGGRRYFTLNQNGVLVDFSTDHIGGFEARMKCPGRELSDAELVEIVRVARETRTDVPPPFDESRTSFSNLRCLRVHSEFALPTSRHENIFFYIDPFGEIVNVHGRWTHWKRGE